MFTSRKFLLFVAVVALFAVHDCVQAQSDTAEIRRENVAQQNGLVQPVAQQNAEKPKITRELWQVLSDWANASSSVKKLHGKHVRRAYDDTFKIEKISQGEFWYESPDKGRIDVEPIKITQQMLDERNDLKNRGVRRNKSTGKPYELKSDLPERWICDGERVFDIDDKRKEAQVVVLPPDIRGENIMNSPLPFLFGMPPEKAVQRFTMDMVKDYRPKYEVVLLEAKPKMRKDAENWSRARIFLNTETYLPSSVELVNPASTRSTVYTFQKMEVNKSGFFDRFIGKSPWDPNLGKDYKIHMIKPGQEQSVAAKASGPVVPNLVGKAHDVAKNMLLQLGVKPENIKKFRGKPAPRKNLIYLVSDQKPKAGTPLRPDQEIQLLIFDDPARAAKVDNAGGASAGRSNVKTVANRN